MNLKQYLYPHKIKIRIIYWVSVVLLMVFVVCPIFFFFYLFDEEHVKEMLYDQYNNKNYYIQVEGPIMPRFWHGLSFEAQKIHVVTNNNIELMNIKTLSCQLSWLDLIRAKYKIKRISLNDVDIYEQNILNFGVKNLLNWANMDKSALIGLKNFGIYNIKSSEESAPYPIVDGTLQIEHKNSQAKFNFGFTLAASDTYVNASSDIDDSDNSRVKFNNFKIKIKNNNLKVNLLTAATYNLDNKNLTFASLGGQVHYKNYLGELNSNLVSLNLDTAAIDNLQLKLNFDNVFANQQLQLNLNNVKINNYQTVDIGKVKLDYLMGIQNNNVVINSLLNNVQVDKLGITSESCSNIINYSEPQLVNKQFKAGLNGNCSYNFQSQQTTLALNGQLNQAPLSLFLQIDDNGFKPQININGNFTSLDLSSFGVANTKIKPFYFNNDKLPFTWLAAFNMQGNIAVESFFLDRAQLNNVKMVFNLKDSVLNVNTLQADIYGGKLISSGRISQINNKYDITSVQKISNLDLRQLFEGLFDVGAISGKADLIVDVNSNNLLSYSDLHKNLNGKVLINASNGAFQGVDLNPFAAPKIDLENNKSTIFDQLSAKLNFVAGVSKTGIVAFNSKYVVANGSGTINLVQNLINYGLTVKSALPPNQQKINSVVIPIVAKGDLFSPTIKIENIHLFTTKQPLLDINKSSKKRLSKRGKLVKGEAKVLASTKPKVKESIKIKSRSSELVLKHKKHQLRAKIVVKNATGDKKIDTSIGALKNRRWDAAIPDDLLPSN